MRRALVAAAALALAGCQMPPVPDGVQLTCHNYGSSNPSGPSQPNNNNNGEDDKCPKDTHCEQGCCIRNGESPRCWLTRADGGSAAPDGGERTVRCSGCVDGPCPAECPGGLTCLSETWGGFPGGLCSAGCGSCPSGFQCAEGEYCLPECAGCADGEPCRCGEGYRCSCAQGPCVCAPSCGPTGYSCGPGPTLNGERCSKSTGRCVSVADCKQAETKGTKCQWPDAG